MYKWQKTEICLDANCRNIIISLRSNSRNLKIKLSKFEDPPVENFRCELSKLKRLVYYYSKKSRFIFFINEYLLEAACLCLYYYS